MSFKTCFPLRSVIVVSGFTSVQGIVVDPKNNRTIYVADPYGGCVWRVTIMNETSGNATMVKIFSSSMPSAVAVSRRDNTTLFVSDWNAGIFILSLDPLSGYGVSHSVLGISSGLTGVAYDDVNGILYGSTQYSGTISLANVTLWRTPTKAQSMSLSVTRPASPTFTSVSSAAVRISGTAQTWTVKYSSSGARSRGSPSISLPSLSGSRTRSSQDTYSSSTASQNAANRGKLSLTVSTSLSFSATCSGLSLSVMHRLASSAAIGTMSLTSLCDDPPFSVNYSLQSADNEPHCRNYLCPTALPLFDGLEVAYDAMIAAPSVLLLLSEDGTHRQWLSLVPQVRLETVTFDAHFDIASSNGTIGLLVLQPSSGWPGLEFRPYAVQHLSLSVVMRCLSGNGSAVSYPTEMVLVVTPRPTPVAASVQAVVQSSQGIAGGLGSGGGTEALTMGRLAMSLSMLSCDNVLQGFGAGQGVVSVSTDLLAAVDTIIGNVGFVTGAAAAALLASCGLHLCASSKCSWMACCRDVLRLPLSLFPVFAATLPSTVMAVVAVLRDALTLSGSAAKGAYCSIVVAAAMWGGALVLVGSATRRMVLAATLRPTRRVASAAAADPACGVVAAVSAFHWAFQSSAVWLSPQPADASLFEGSTVLWLLPLDVCTTVTLAVASALPLSRSAALCVGANAFNVAGCGVMLAVAVVRRPFATVFSQVHSVVTCAMVLALAVCGLVLTATSDDDLHSMKPAVSYLAAVLSALKAAVDAANIVAATRRRFHTLTDSRPQSSVCEEKRLGDVVVGAVGEHDGHAVALPVADVNWDCEMERLKPEVDVARDEESLLDPLRLLPVADSYHLGSSDRLGDLLDAYPQAFTDDNDELVIEHEEKLPRTFPEASKISPFA